MFCKVTWSKLHLNPINYKNKISRQEFIDKQKKYFQINQSYEVNIKNDYIIEGKEDNGIKKIFNDSEFSKILRKKTTK